MAWRVRDPNVWTALVFGVVASYLCVSVDMMTICGLLRALALLAPLAASTPSPASLDSDLAILLDNNLQGESRQHPRVTA